MKLTITIEAPTRWAILGVLVDVVRGISLPTKWGFGTSYEICDSEALVRGVAKIEE
jgi:hypothetical protein